MSDNVKEKLEEAKQRLEDDVNTLKAVHSETKILKEERHEAVKEKLESVNNQIKDKVNDELDVLKAVSAETRVLKEERHEAVVDDIKSKIDEKIKK